MCRAAWRGERLAMLGLFAVVGLLAVVPIARLALQAIAPAGRIDASIIAGITISICHSR